MADTKKKYLSLDRLTEYDALIKAKIDSAEKNANDYTDEKVANLASTTVVDNKISAHNTATDAHSDIREVLAAVKEDVDAFFKDADLTESAKDTLKEIQEYITSDAQAASDMLNAIGDKADKDHDHTTADITDFATEMAKKADKDHGTHVTWSTTSPKMDGTASVGSEVKVARGDHVHPTDTTRAAKSDLEAHTGNTTVHITADERTKWDAAKTHADSAHAPVGAQANVIESIKVNGTAQTIGTDKSVNITVPTNNNQLTNGAGYLVASDIANKADKSTTLSGYGIDDAYTKAEVDAKTAVDSALSSTSENPVQNKVVNSAIVSVTEAIGAHTTAINGHTDRIKALEDEIGEGFEPISSTEIQNLFK